MYWKEGLKPGVLLVLHLCSPLLLHQTHPILPGEQP